MEANGLGSGLFSGINSGMLGLEMSPQQYQHLQPQQNPQNPNLTLTQHPPQAHPHHTMVSFGQNEVDHHHTQNQQPVKQGYPFGAKPRTQQLTFSDDDEPVVAAEDSGEKRNNSPWQRMKWTDGMVKLLIMMVYYIGDDQGNSEGNDVVGKKKGGIGGGALQKKGKWKSVSKAMMERGFFVSPQQCEDKFNDLNKRYKRVNDILGKGTSCKVVENQSLLESMDLSPKTKEEVKKLLNSKHLFFREMCAYHNSCNGGAAQHSAEAGADSAHIQHQQQKRTCLHTSVNSPNVHNVGRTETEGSKMMKGVSVEEEDDNEGDNDNDDEDDNDEVEGGARGHEHESDIDNKTISHKRTRNEMYASDSTSFQEFSNELKHVIQDGTKSSWEKRQWMRMRLMQFEEQRMNHQCQAFELEKQKMKWLKFRHKKEKDMEAERLVNERTRLQNERMILILRQKELELLDFQQPNQSCNRSSMAG